MRMLSNDELWRRIRQADSNFALFTNRNGIWRDWNNHNPAFDVNVEKGVWFDHRSYEGGNLYQLAQSIGIVLSDNHKNEKTNFPSSEELWRKALRNDSVTKTYLTLHRKIPEDNYNDLLNFFRIGKCWTGETTLFHPFFSPEKINPLFSGESVEPPRVQLILLDEKGNKLRKLHRGQTGDLPVAFVLPPHSGEQISIKALVLEGLENALSVRCHFQNSWIGFY